MLPLPTTLVNEFVTNQGTEKFGDVIVEIAYLFEKSTGRGHGLDAQEQITRFGWTERVAQADEGEASDKELEPLMQAICQFILQAPTDPYVGSATWALGKLARANLKPLLVTALQQQVEGDPNALYQTMIALANIGEWPFGDATSMNLLDVERNRRAALQYLQRP